MRAMVLAAGFGTRLGALSDELPKPLLPVADAPILRYGLSLLAGHGFREVAINLHHHGDDIIDELRADSPVAITWSREERILGTGGGLRRMAGWLSDGSAPFLVMNGKLILDVDLGALVERHARSGAVATMVVREVADAEKWGAVDLDERGRVLRILGSGAEGAAARRTMFCGVHVLSPSLLARLPEGESCVIRQGYLPALAAGERVEAVVYDGYFAEHSTPERYLDGNFAVIDGSARLRHAPAPRDGVDETARVAESAALVPPFRIGPGAVIGEGARVGPYAIVGGGAEVAAGARLARTVVWRGARVTGEVEGAIVTRRRGAFRVAAQEVVPEKEGRA